jgi:hypothetical protein
MTHTHAHMYVCMYVCVCVCVCVYTHAHTYTHVCVCIYICRIRVLQLYGGFMSCFLMFHFHSDSVYWNRSNTVSAKLNFCFCVDKDV